MPERKAEKAQKMLHASLAIVSLPSRGMLCSCVDLSKSFRKEGDHKNSCQASIFHSAD